MKKGSNAHRITDELTRHHVRDLRKLQSSTCAGSIPIQWRGLPFFEIMRGQPYRLLPAEKGGFQTQWHLGRCIQSNCERYIHRVRDAVAKANFIPKACSVQNLTRLFLLFSTTVNLILESVQHWCCHLGRVEDVQKIFITRTLARAFLFYSPHKMRLNLLNAILLAMLRTTHDQNLLHNIFLNKKP